MSDNAIYVTGSNDNTIVFNISSLKIHVNGFMQISQQFFVIILTYLRFCKNLLQYQKYNKLEKDCRYKTKSVAKTQPVLKDILLTLVN